MQTAPVHIGFDLTPAEALATARMLDTLSRGPLGRIRLDLTTRCNLRCVYCAVSQSTYRGEDMPAAMSDRALKEIIELSHEYRPREIHINGHGETTFIDGWVEVCESLLEHGFTLWITTNLAKSYSARELAVLARMCTIAVSIDTCDADLLKRMRRKVDLRQIVTNITMIRTAALKLNKLGPPSFEFSSGLYDKNSLFIEEFADFAVALGINRVNFWNLTTWSEPEFPYHNTDVAEADRAYPLDSLPPEEIRPRLAAIQRAIVTLDSNGIKVDVNGNFIETLANQCREAEKQTVVIDALELQKGMTRDCLDPWIYAEVETNGDVKPCCARKGVGNLNQATLAEILNGEPIKRLRNDLLQGTLDKDCAFCPLTAPVKPKVLQEKVQALNSQPSLKGGGEPLMQVLAADSQKIENLLSSALTQIRAGRKTIELAAIAHAFELQQDNRGDIPRQDIVRNHLAQILEKAKSPATLSLTAAICREIGDRQSALTLMRSYIEVAPNAPDRDHVLADIASETPPKPPLTLRLQDSWTKLRLTLRLRTRARRLAASLLKTKK